MSSSELMDVNPACGVRLGTLRRFHFKELAADEHGRIQAHLAGCADCQRRTEAMTADGERALASVNVAVESAAILARLERAPDSALAPLWRSLQFRVLALGLSVAFGAVVLAPMVRQMLMPETHHHRLKGSDTPELQMWVNTGSGARPGADGEKLGEGDQIQFRYKASGRPYLMVVSLDGKGVLTPLYPDSKGQSLKVAPDGDHVLEGSVILDDAKGPERILGFFSKEPLDYDVVERVLKQRLEAGADPKSLDGLEVGRDTVTDSVLIMKE